MSANANNRDAVGRVPPHGVPTDARVARVGRLFSAGARNAPPGPNAASGDAVYNTTGRTEVGRVPSRGVPGEPSPRRLRRLHRVWPDRDGNISYLLTLSVGGRARVLDNELTFERLVSFLLDSPNRYHWFGRRFVIMPDHVHVIAHQGHDAVRLGQWIKAMKVVVGGLAVGRLSSAGDPTHTHRVSFGAHVGRGPSHGVQMVGGLEQRPVGSPGLQTAIVGRGPSHGDLMRPDGAPSHEFTRVKRSWRWQSGFHDHKFRSPESAQHKWEYVCLNPVRAGLVKRPEEWPFAGEIVYDQAGGPRLVRGTPPLLKTRPLIEGTPVEGNRPTT